MECLRCGRKNNKPQEFWPLNHVCKFCRRKGHYVKMCETKQPNLREFPTFKIGAKEKIQIWRLFLSMINHCRCRLTQYQDAQ
ncbi:hypothetical protein LAZ67_X000578 [Cordylochernes scorpioides]|uniref:Uncharacterized protein n=1 Tax=Cordylochernes scorpioides TaxID=51811 RepID=A0ABY6LWJ9_9ARAC|nr:hypothetical protein LAZ67_X000578 [Cordylochernes scorpioides]